MSRRVDGGALEAVEIGLDGKPIRVLARNAFEPVYSPDGRSIALLRGPYKEVTKHFPRHGRLNISAHLTDIFIRSASGGGLRQVTDTDRAAEEIPRWDPSGQHPVYTEWRPFDYGKETAEVQESVAFGPQQGDTDDQRRRCLPDDRPLGSGLDVLRRRLPARGRARSAAG